MVLDQLTRSGLIVQADGDRLIISPKSKLTDEIRKYVKDHKQEIMDELRRPQVPPSHSETGSGQPTLPGEGETGLKTQNQGHCRSCQAFTTDPERGDWGLGFCHVKGHHIWTEKNSGCVNFCEGGTP